MNKAVAPRLGGHGGPPSLASLTQSPRAGEKRWLAGEEVAGVGADLARSHRRPAGARSLGPRGRGGVCGSRLVQFMCSAPYVEEDGAQNFLLNFLHENFEHQQDPEEHFLISPLKVLIPEEHMPTIVSINQTACTADRKPMYCSCYNM